MYILCCGYPPFYSRNGQPISPGMKRKIRAGNFEFPEAEWGKVSDEAKKLIKGMLETEPEKRLTIDDIIKSPWISRYYSVPATPLSSLDILKKDIDLHEFQQSMGSALDEMRINWDSKIQLKELKIINNPLFERRMNKKTKDSESADLQSLNNINNKTNENMPKAKIDMDEINRETSILSIKSITPTNSRKPSPNR